MTSSATLSEPRTPTSTWQRWSFLGSALLYALPSIWLLGNYLQPAFDLAIYDQSLWLLLRGETFNTVGGAHVFGGHFSPILILLSPISLIPGGAVPEIVIQSLWIASGVFPAAAIARRFGKSEVWLMAIYALHPAIIGGSWYGFRPWNLAVPAILWLAAWILERPSVTSVTVSGLTLLVFREDMALWVGLLATILVMAGHIRVRDYLASGVILGAVTGFVVLGIIPEFAPTGSYFFASSTETGLQSVDANVASIATRVIFLLAPLGVVPWRLNWKLLAPLSLPVLGLMVKGGNALTTFFHYDMMFVPLLLVIVGLSESAENRARATLWLSLVVLVLLGALRPIAPQHGANPFRIDREMTRELDAVVRELRALPGSDQLSLAGPSRVLPHLSERKNVFIYPSPFRQHRTQDDGYQFVDLLRYDCPDPNLVIVGTNEIQSTVGIDLQNYEQILVTENFLLLQRSRQTPNGPCSTTWSTTE